MTQEELNQMLRPPPEPWEPTEDATSVLMSRSHSDVKGAKECDYCFGKRTNASGEEEKDLEYFKLGMTTNKLKVSDYEILLQKGFTRCGSYIYIRNPTKSCCEVYQYKVRVDEFKINKNQKQTMRRFHRYI